MGESRKPFVVLVNEGVKQVLRYDYTFWLERFKCILVAYREHQISISDDMLQSLQLFLLDTGQFNAGFTAQELKKMNYPRTPFAVTEEHAYLRATDTWATKILSDIYREQIKQEVFPIWVDSDFFWEELTRYCRVIKFELAIKKRIDDFETNDAVWVEIDKNDPRRDYEAFILSVKQKCLDKILNQKGYSQLKSVFLGVCINNKSEYNKSEYNKSEYNKSEYNEDLKQLLGIDKVPNNEKIKQWYNKNVKTLIEAVLKQTICFYKGSIYGIEGIVFFEKVQSYNYGCKLINSLGYRIDSTRAIRILLANKYKKLFVEADITEKFWQELNRIKPISKLSDEEKKHIEMVQAQVIEQLKSDQEKTNETINLNQELVKLNASRSQINHSMFHIYKEYIVKYIYKYLKIDDKSIIRIVADAEIKMALGLFLEANETGNLPMMIRATQIIAEVMQLDLMVVPLEKNFVGLVKNEYLKKYPVQNISLTPFAMRAFVRILQTSCLDKNDTVNMAITNQSYYELLENFERLDPHKRKVMPIRHVEELSENIDMIFMEIHPNNVIEAKQFAHNLNLLVAKLTGFPRKKRTLILDVTLNTLDDKEISSFLDCSSSLIHSGDLSVVLIQSLTKFAQLGLDKKSAGCLITINNNDCTWRKTNQRLLAIDSGEKTDDSTKQFFSYFLSTHKNLLNEYITKINENVQYVYRKVVETINFLEVQNRNRFQFTTSSDKQACYVALNINGLFPEINKGFTFAEADMEGFGKDVLTCLFHPLCDFFQLSVTERASVGFPLSNINLVYGSLRFTIGLESTQHLDQYAAILSYISFVINRPNDVSLFYDQDLRRKYFQEKVNQFRAMTPGKGHECIISFDGLGSSNAFTDRLGFERQLQRKAVMLNGDLILCIEKSQQNGPIFVNYFADRIFIPSSEFGDISFLDQRAPAYLKRMAAACLTECAKNKEQNIKFTIHNFQNRIDFSSFEILEPWSEGIIYGPFHCVNDNHSVFSFHFYNKKMKVLINSIQPAIQIQVLVQQGNIVTPLTDMSIDEIKKVVFSDSDYQISGEMVASNVWWPISSRYNIKHDKLVFHYLKDKSQLIMQLDDVILRDFGVTVYRRFFDKEKTIVEIDFWGTKDPILARFMRLITAVCVKEGNNISFVSMDNNYSRFLFKDSYDNIGKLFNTAIKLILDNKEELYKLLLKFKKQEGSNYSFMASDAMFSSPNIDDISSVKAKELIDETLNVLKSCPINNADTLRSTMCFQFSNAIKNNKRAIAFTAVAVCAAGGCYYKLKMQM